jgi:hypothetical protein
MVNFSSRYNSMMRVRRHKLFTIAVVSCFVFLQGGIATAQTDKEKEVKRIYKQLMDAENEHDLSRMRALVWNSPSTLFVAKAPVVWHGYWGVDNIMQRLHDMYRQPFRIDPIYEEEEVVFITPEIAETYVPVRIAVAHAGQNPVPKPFVMVLLWINSPQGRKMTTDIPIPGFLYRRIRRLTDLPCSDGGWLYRFQKAYDDRSRNRSVDWAGTI